MSTIVKSDTISMQGMGKKVKHILAEISNVIKNRILCSFLWSIVFLLSCDALTPPSQIELPDNPVDGMNPNAVPEIVNIEFISRSINDGQVEIAIKSRGTTEVRFCEVDQTGDQINSSYQPVQPKYRINLSIGNHLLAAQGRALNGNESPVMYQYITVQSGLTGGEQYEFALVEGEKSIIMCWIPPGELNMGAQDNEIDYHDDELPHHQVIISQGFWMGKYEVTQSEWEAVTGQTPSQDAGADKPVDWVSWEHIEQCFLSQIDSHYRLPTEAEWEYACRGGVSIECYFWGSDPDKLSDYSWYTDNSNLQLHNVGSLNANPWGLHDILGNVWEWCNDWYDDDYYHTCTPSVSDPKGPPSGFSRVVRGGGINTTALDCRPANRHFKVPTRWSPGLGFRLVRDIK